MNEVRQIHLGRQAYIIAADAYAELHNYLEAIKKEVGKEVSEEVELRMAELLTERGVTGKKVILSHDVTFLKEQLGTPSDFSENKADSDEPADAEGAAKRLFRDTDNAMIAGVAAGLSKYLDIDVVIIRLIFVALTFFGASGVLIYIVLWLLVPEAKTKSERLQMSGLAVNVENIKRTINEADVPGATRRASAAIGKVLLAAAKVLLAIIGFVFVVAGIGVLISGAVATIYGLVHGMQVGNVTLFPVGGEEIAVLVCAFVVLGLVGGMLAVSGVALARRKWGMPGWATAAVIVTFIAAVSVGAGLGSDVASTVRQRYQKVEHSRHIAIAPFTKLHFIGNNVFYISEPGPKADVEIRTFGNVDTSKIVASERDGTLTIDTSKFHPSRGCDILCPFGETNAEVVIRTPDTVQHTSADAASDIHESIYGTGGVY